MKSAIIAAITVVGLCGNSNDCDLSVILISIVVNGGEHCCRLSSLKSIFSSSVSMDQSLLGKTRQMAIDRFQATENMDASFIMLLSTRAGVRIRHIFFQRGIT